MTIRNPLSITAVLILATTLVLWVGFVLTLLGVTDLLKSLVGAGGQAIVVYAMIVGPVVGLITAATAWKRQAREQQ